MLDYNKAIIILGVSYLFTLFYFYIKTCKNKWNINIFIILTLLITPYNILITRISDTNKLEIINFLYRIKIYKLSLMDILLITYFLYFTIKNLKELKIKNDVIVIYFIRDIIFLIITTCSYIYFKGYFLDNGIRYINGIRNYIYFYISFFLSYFFYKKNKNFNYLEFIKNWFIFSVILSFLFKREDLWIRYGYRVIILSQEWIIVLQFLISILIFKLLLKNRHYLNILFLSLILLFNFSKISIVWLLCLGIFYLLFYKKLNKTRLLCYCVISFLICFLLTYIFTIKLKNDIALNTRLLQVEQLIKDMKNRDKLTYGILFGSGMGTPYKGEMGDTGESRAIDRERFGNYKFDIQTPIFSLWKDIGVIGIIIMYIFNIVLLKIILNKKKVEFLNTDDKAEYYSIIYFLAFNLVFLQNYFNTPLLSSFNGLLIAKFSLLREKVVKNKFKGRKNGNALFLDKK